MCGGVICSDFKGVSHYSQDNVYHILHTIYVFKKMNSPWSLRDYHSPMIIMIVISIAIIFIIVLLFLGFLDNESQIIGIILGALLAGLIGIFVSSIQLQRASIIEKEKKIRVFLTAINHELQKYDELINSIFKKTNGGEYSGHSLERTLWTMTLSDIGVIFQDEAFWLKEKNPMNLLYHDLFLIEDENLRISILKLYDSLETGQTHLRFFFSIHDERAGRYNLENFSKEIQNTKSLIEEIKSNGYFKLKMIKNI